MNREHMERLASHEWHQSLVEHVFPFALGGLTLDDLGDDVLEVGPGPGRTTDLLRASLDRLTAIELDEGLAVALADRLAGTNVEVVHGDASAMPLPDGRFSGVVTFAMLHHVPTTAKQDAVFADVLRVLRPGGLFIAMDGVPTGDFQAMHADDIYNPVDADTLAGRITGAGFTDVDVRSNPRMWAVHARRPA